MAKRPRVRVQPWPKGHACAFNLKQLTFNLKQLTLAKRPRVRVQP
ncbi:MULTISPECIES: hypothetical protein [unclassified Moorena]|nr:MULTISPECIES: hypothetical protein [unclassified Moorena]